MKSHCCRFVHGRAMFVWPWSNFIPSLGDLLSGSTKPCRSERTFLLDHRFHAEFVFFSSLSIQSNSRDTRRLNRCNNVTFSCYPIVTVGAVSHCEDSQILNFFLFQLCKEHLISLAFWYILTFTIYKNIYLELMQNCRNRDSRAQTLRPKEIWLTDCKLQWVTE